MNRSYQVYLQNQSGVFTKRVVTSSVVFLILLTALYFIGKHFAQSNIKAEEQRQKIEMSSSKSTSLSANKAALVKAFDELSSVRRENSKHGRQYIIEFLTKAAANAGLSNFVIENISQKDSLIGVIYNDVQKISGITLFEVEITFNSILSSQMMSFAADINTNINGVAVLVQNETRRVIDDIDQEMIESINMGQKISMLGNRMVLHWFFIK
jgi:hypothetical protein